jgi:hypothetical protein
MRRLREKDEPGAFYYRGDGGAKAREMKRKKMTKKKIFNGSAFGRPDQARPSGATTSHCLVN